MTARAFTHLVLIAGLAGFGCGAGTSQEPARTAYAPARIRPPQPNYAFDTSLPNCPMQVPETKLTSLAIEGGAALVFTTTSSPKDLRTRIQALAREYDSDTTPAGVGGRSEIVEVPGGARLNIRAQYLRDTATMREHLRQRAADMRRTRSCPQMNAALAHAENDEYGTKNSSASAAAEWCPASVPGVNVRATRSASGIALEFTTTADRTAEVRKRARDLAGVYAGPQGLTRDDVAPMARNTGEPGPAYTTTLEVIPAGARIVIIAGNQAELAAIHRTLAEHAEVMRSGKCPVALQPLARR
jgi:hypothetical protein